MYCFYQEDDWTTKLFNAPIHFCKKLRRDNLLEVPLESNYQLLGIICLIIIFMKESRRKKATLQGSSWLILRSLCATSKSLITTREKKDHPKPPFKIKKSVKSLLSLFVFRQILQHLCGEEKLNMSLRILFLPSGIYFMCVSLLGEPPSSPAHTQRHYCTEKY